MTTEKYFELTEKAGNFYRSNNYEKSLDCCIKIIDEISSIKKQIPDFKELNKDFILYSIFNLFKLGATDDVRKLFQGIISANIIEIEKIKDDINFELDNLDNIEFAENILAFLKSVSIFSESEVEDILASIKDSLE
ncbi:hypothetical protein K7I13_07265 [Brucepastera parasyntrophica]|uniref:hypothetical protein n=1 Tax=Brucepastera parasyntrophica TaxID=2880008 RepID=UPI00210B35D8|nr:hypothetical protein [Brucepastera parasyntrophica]ULQ61043.1 hypothetical protein K7I13_07265 [Brucepastera parasyntrophica]